MPHHALYISRIPTILSLRQLDEDAGGSSCSIDSLAQAPQALPLYQYCAPPQLNSFIVSSSNCNGSEQEEEDSKR